MNRCRNLLVLRNYFLPVENRRPLDADEMSNRQLLHKRNFLRRILHLRDDDGPYGGLYDGLYGGLYGGPCDALYGVLYDGGLCDVLQSKIGLKFVFICSKRDNIVS